MAWPDRGVPESSVIFLNFLRTAMTQQSVAASQAKINGEAKPPPITVHCSAGVGRTGVFCVVYACITYLPYLGQDGNSHIDVHDTIVRLRECRRYMVQTMDQYKFCHRAVLHAAKLYLDGSRQLGQEAALSATAAAAVDQPAAVPATAAAAVHQPAAVPGVTAAAIASSTAAASPPPPASTPLAKPMSTPVPVSIPQAEGAPPGAASAGEMADVGYGLTVNSVGSAVTVSSFGPGTLRYVGFSKSGTPCCGVELDEGGGLHDGSVDGVRYFK